MSSLSIQVWCLRLESLTIDGRSGLPQPATGGMMRNGWTSAKIHAPSQRKQIHRVWRDCVNDVKIPEHTLPSLKHLSVYPIICHPKSTCAWPMERSNLQMKGRSEQEFQMTSILRSCKLRMLIRLWWLVVFSSQFRAAELPGCLLRSAWTEVILGFWLFKDSWSWWKSSTHNRWMIGYRWLSSFLKAESVDVQRISEGFIMVHP